MLLSNYCLACLLLELEYGEVVSQYTFYDMDSPLFPLICTHSNVVNLVIFFEFEAVRQVCIKYPFSCNDSYMMMDM